MNFRCLTANPIFFAILESVILANGLSAPQHSTYFVIFEDGLFRIGGPPGVAIKKTQNKNNRINSLS